MSRVHRAGRWVLARAAHGPWSTAVLAELDQVTGRWATVRWVAGGLRIAWRERLGAGWRRRVLRLVAGAVVAVVAVSQLLTVRFIPTSAMEPTLRVADRVLVDRLSFRVTGLRHGDLVVLTVHDGADTFTMVSRVVGLAGDRISCADGRVFRNSIQLDEPYVHGAETLCLDATVPEGRVYVMGDNRPMARDSRYFGSQPASSVSGRLL
ncbi:signal peptidase I [Dactylosporangium sp. AC04546]|uniref:signal peptidase I n=1 Tax=Dactylosporangium sp. AC04546 TaxID=2862460 RepID=UPI001EDFCC81|nr:signal peptidase I [Dactylosporangium sp. AC04546]WVK86353.1 signal peptidase I [Dactylosporangium sp. AC04546]